ncbi:hypothetical protein D3C76_1165840 [compost metagenome]
MDGGHGQGLAVVHQGAFGDRRAANAAGNGRQHLGVAQVDLRLLQRGLGLQAGGLGLIVGLLAHRLVADQVLVAFRQGLGRGQAGLSALVGGGVDSRVDLVELLPGLDFAAFGEQALLDDAVHLRAHFGDAVGAGAAGQLGGEGETLGLEGDDADLGRLGGRRSRGFLATGEKERGQRDGGNQGGKGWLHGHLKGPHLSGVQPLVEGGAQGKFWNIAKVCEYTYMRECL